MKPAVLDGVAQRYGQISGNESETPMMDDANYDGPLYRIHHVRQGADDALDARRHRGRHRRERAMRIYAKTWRFKHPSPWDFMFAMNRELEARTSSWFWYYWLFTTESVNGSIANVVTKGEKTHGHRAAGRRDAVAGGAQGGVRRRAARRHQADEERRDRSATRPR